MSWASLISKSAGAGGFAGELSGGVGCMNKGVSYKAISAVSILRSVTGLGRNEVLLPLERHEVGQEIGGLVVAEGV